jgi:dienelactone hydrolase
MGTLRRLGLLAAALFVFFAGPAQATPPGTVMHFTSLDPDRAYKLSGTLYMPESAPPPVPAIVMVHGTAGINTVGAFYKDSILQAGIAILEVDFKTGIYSGPFSRPSPDTLVAMGFAALKELRKLPAIDPDRIGIMGFSMGGHLAVNTAFESKRKQWMGDQKGFATHVAFYPVCKSFLKQDDTKPTGAPMIIFYGTLDAYGEGEFVPKFKSMMMDKYHFDVTTVEYPGVHHDFNRNEPPMSYRDPAAINHRGYVEWNAAAANDSLPRTVDFLRRTLSVK